MLRAFDPQLHHIGLGPRHDHDASDGIARQYGFLLSSGYNKRGQNSAPPVDYGGERDLITAPSLSRWTMDDLSGGIGQYVWGDDPAMVARTFNMIPSTGKRTIRTCPPFVGWHVENIGNRTPIYTFAYGNALYGVFGDRVRAISVVDESRFDFVPDESGAGQPYEITAATFDRNTATLLLAIYREYAPGAFDHKVYGVKPGNPIVETNQFGLEWSAIGNDAWNKRIFGIYAAPTFVLAQSGANLYTTQPKVDGTAPTWVDRGRLPGPWKDEVSHNGLTYILCGDSNVRRGSVIAFDGANLLPICEFPYNFTPLCIESYGGRVYVGGTGKDIGDAEKYAELYEITGGSLRLIKSWVGEGRIAGVAKPRAFYALHVHEGLLWMHDLGNGLLAYDVTTDAIFGAANFEPPTDIQRSCRGFASVNEALYGYIYHALDASQCGWYRVAQPADNIQMGYEGRVVTSDFSPQPDRRKRWAEVAVATKYIPAGLRYNTDGSLENFTGIDAYEVEQRGDYYVSRYNLADVPPSSGIRFQINLMRNLDTVNWAELLGFTLAFQFLDSGRWAWTFTISGAELMEGPDGGGVEQDVHDIGSELRRYWRERVPLRFRDLDGETYDVQLLDLQEAIPVVSESVGHVNPGTLAETSAQEALYTVSLVEV